ncbi:hypothetical protein ACWDRX_37815, partial [Streptomyces nigra]
MQPRIPRQSTQEQDSRRQDAARPSDELTAVVSGARRRAVRDGDRHVDTAHLLHSLLEHDPAVHAVMGEGPQVARLLGYLVQRSIGYGRAGAGRAGTRRRAGRAARSRPCSRSSRVRCS